MKNESPTPELPRVSRERALEIESETLAAAGAVVRVDLRACETKAEALAAVGRAFAFPSWFGLNWDALADCLRDLEFDGIEARLVLVEGLERWRARSESEVETLLEILLEAVDDFARVGLVLRVLLVESPPNGA